MKFFSFERMRDLFQLLFATEILQKNVLFL